MGRLFIYLSGLGYMTVTVDASERILLYIYIYIDILKLIMIDYNGQDPCHHLSELFFSDTHSSHRPRISGACS